MNNTTVSEIVKKKNLTSIYTYAYMYINKCIVLHCTIIIIIIIMIITMIIYVIIIIIIIKIIMIIIIIIIIIIMYR